MSKLKVNELDTESGTTITVAAGKTIAGTDIIGSTQIAAGAVDTSEIAANAVTLAEMAGITRGSIIVGDASGDPSYLTKGTNGQVLKSDGTDVAWAADEGLPTQTNNAGKKLMTDGTNASWQPSPGRNYIRNGQFNIWQRGTTITNASNLAMGYSADGWRDEGYAWTGSVSRQTFVNGQTDVPDNPTYFLRWIVTANPSGFNALVQRIENYPVNRLSGKTIVVSFWIKSVSGTLADGVIKCYGKNSLDGSGTDNIGAITTSWQKISFSGTLGTITGTSWTTGFTTDQNTVFANGVDIANFQVEEGSTPTAFDQKTYGQELYDAKRYFRHVNKQFYCYAISGTVMDCFPHWEQEMRANPSCILNTTTPAFYEINVATRTGSGSAISTGTFNKREAFVRIDGISSLSTNTFRYLISTENMFSFSAEL